MEKVDNWKVDRLTLLTLLDLHGENVHCACASEHMRNPIARGDT